MNVEVLTGTLIQMRGLHVSCPGDRLVWAKPNQPARLSLAIAFP